MISNILLVIPEISPSAGHLIGAIISLVILGYLLYSLIKPEKF